MPTKPQPPRAQRNAEARCRLRDAQRRESASLNAVYSAEDRLNRAEAKRQAAIEAADETVELARRELGTAQHELVGVSGLARAAQLLGMSRSGLRRSASDRLAEADENE